MEFACFSVDTLAAEICRLGGTGTPGRMVDAVLSCEGETLAEGLRGVRARFPDAWVHVLADTTADVADLEADALVRVELPPADQGGWTGWGAYFVEALFTRLDADAAENQEVVEVADAAVAAASAGGAGNPAAPPGHARAARDEARREEQRAENLRLQDDEGAMIPANLTLDEMLERCIWLAEGEVVAYVTADRSQFLSYKEFRAHTAESKTLINVAPNGNAKSGGDRAAREQAAVSTAKLWQADPRRKGAMTRTFRAGAGVICSDPEGSRAVNLWRPITRRPATVGVELFLGHVEYLFDNSADFVVFLDWLAHIEQFPVVLPHYGWLHIASHTGCGRNWLASLLARVWRGYVAPNVDLPALLDSQYNGSIARRVLAIVDEIQEGGSGNRRHTNRLTGLLNAETRLINPKFGRQFQEFNSCRWLVFSNHTNALPIDNTDRRWRVIAHDKPPRPPVDYERLYAALNDAEFINAVGVFFRERDISRFRPGERPPMNAAKAAVIESSKPLQTAMAEDILSHWPADIILNDHVAQLLGDGEHCAYTPAMRRAMEEVGAVSLSGQLKVRVKAQRGWILRRAAVWREASKDAQRQEIMRPDVCNTRSVQAVLADAIETELPI